MQNGPLFFDYLIMPSFCDFFSLGITYGFNPQKCKETQEVGEVV